MLHCAADVPYARRRCPHVQLPWLIMFTLLCVFPQMGTHLYLLMGTFVSEQHTGTARAGALEGRVGACGASHTGAAKAAGGAAQCCTWHYMAGAQL